MADTNAIRLVAHFGKNANEWSTNPKALELLAQITKTAGGYSIQYGAGDYKGRKPETDTDFPWECSVFLTVYVYGLSMRDRVTRVVELMNELCAASDEDEVLISGEEVVAYGFASNRPSRRATERFSYFVMKDQQAKVEDRVRTASAKDRRFR